jgi:hypothetical protein
MISPAHNEEVSKTFDSRSFCALRQNAMLQTALLMPSPQYERSFMLSMDANV